MNDDDDNDDDHDDEESTLFAYRFVESLFDQSLRERWFFRRPINQKQQQQTKKESNKNDNNNDNTNGNKNEKSPETKKAKIYHASSGGGVLDDGKNNNNNNDNNGISSFLLFQEEEPMLKQIASYLEPHEILSMLSTCRLAFFTILPTMYQVRWQSILNYFSILQSYVTQLESIPPPPPPPPSASPPRRPRFRSKINTQSNDKNSDVLATTTTTTKQQQQGYDRKNLVRYFTTLARTLQSIYGQAYIVHPLHRALVAQKILNDLCGVNVYLEEEEYDDNEEEEIDRSKSQPGPWFHPKARQLPLTRDLFFTKFARFAWSVVMGDHYYSFSQSGCLEYGHGEDMIDIENVKENVLYKEGRVWVYMYQDEDNFDVVGLSAFRLPDGKNIDPPYPIAIVGFESGEIVYPGIDDYIDASSPYFRDGLMFQEVQHYKSLAHYYVLGERLSGIAQAPGLKEISARTVRRIYWLYQRKLLPFTITNEDWVKLFESVKYYDDGMKNWIGTQDNDTIGYATAFD